MSSENTICERGTLSLLPRPSGMLQRHHDVLKFCFIGETLYAVPFHGSVVVYHHEALEEVVSVGFSKTADVVVSTDTLAIIQDSSRRLLRAFDRTRPHEGSESEGSHVTDSEHPLGDKAVGRAIERPSGLLTDSFRETQLGRTIGIGMMQ